MIWWVGIDNGVTIQVDVVQNLNRIAVHDFAHVGPASSPKINNGWVEVDT